MHGTKPVHPGRGSAAPTDRRDQFSENIKAILETAISLRLQNAEQLGFAHMRDYIVSDAAVRFGFLHAGAHDLGDCPGARQQLWHVGFARR